MADILNQNGLSIGALSQSDFGWATPTVVAPGSSPAQRINQAQAQLHQIAKLQYPLDLPKYYMGFQIAQYHRESLMQVAFTNILSQVCLPFPDQLLDINQVAYDKKSFMSTIGNAVNSGFDVFNSFGGNTDGIKQAVHDQFGNLLKGGLNGAPEDILTGLTGGVGAGIQGAVGYSPNYFLTVILSGPQYKQYSFTWTFAPRSPQESATLRQIIRVFQDAQAPGLADGNVLFSFPRLFQPYFAPDRAMLYQFKPSILMNFAVNYTPAGMPSMKQTDQDNLQGYHAPTALRVQATFMELEFWLRSDFGNTSPSAVGPQEFSNHITPDPGPGRGSD